MPAKLVLLVGSRDHDASISVVRGHLKRDFGATVAVLDGSDLGEGCHISASLDSGSGQSIVSRQARADFALDQVQSVWLRRWHDPRVLAGLRSTADLPEFARENWTRFLTGVWLSAGVKCVNEPDKQWRSGHKLLQLRVARDLGFRVPRTLCTTEPQAAAHFIEKHADGVVCKALATTFTGPATKTVLLSREHVTDLEAVRLMPTLLQELIPADRDVRVIVIGDMCFAGEVRTAAGSDPIDWREDPDNPWSRHALPNGVEAACLDLTRSLGLSYGAIDLRLTPSGEYVFFEINPGGQFLFLEVWTAMPIAQALASYLAE